MTVKCPKCHFENLSDTCFCGNCAAPLHPSEVRPAFPTATLQTPIKELTTGSTFAGRYQIIEELGKGGMGTVYKVRDTQINEDLALKIIRPEIAADVTMIERFRNELKITRKISHKNICRTHDINEEDGTPYITMEYVAGEDLKSLIRREKSLAEEQAVSIAKQVCSGLSAAHELGVVHRDLKPQNIMIDEKGQAKIMDFGIARSVEAGGVTQSGVMIGTPDYISPEQVEGEETDQRSDIYAMGVILYEMVTGSVPFRGDTALSVALKHTSKLPQDPRKLNPGVSDDLSRLILICMEKDREKRYQTAEALLNDLSNIEEGLPLGTKIRPRRTTFTQTLIRKKLLIPALVVALAIVALIGRLLLSQKEVAPSEPSKSSIAVLPFDNLSGDKSNEYFSDGITETIIVNLAAIKGLSVRSRTSIVQYKGTSMDLREIGKELNVTHILEGSVIQSGSRVRIMAQLIDAQTDKHLWAQTYDRDLKDIFEIQSEVSSQVANTLKVTLTPGVQAHLERKPTTNLQAYDYYLQGKFYSYRTTLGDIDLALRMFERAIALDPAFAQAYAGLALTCIKRDFYFEPGQGWDKKAFQAAEKALALDPNLAEGYVARGNLYWTRANFFPHEKAIREYRRALELNPNLDEAHLYLGRVYMHIGLLDEAIFEFKKALELDPTNFGAEYRLGLTFHYQGRYREAVSIMERLKEAGQLANDWELVMALFALGEKENPTLLIEKTFRELPGDSDVLSTRAVIFASEGKEAQTEEMIRLAVEKGNGMGHFHHPEYNIGLAYALLKKNAKAIEWLKRAAEDGLPCYPMFLSDPSLKNLRSDPRFISFLDELKRQWEGYKAKFSGPQFPE